TEVVIKILGLQGPSATHDPFEAGANGTSRLPVRRRARKAGGELDIDDGVRLAYAGVGQAARYIDEKPLLRERHKTNSTTNRAEPINLLAAEGRNGKGIQALGHHGCPRF